MVESRILKSVLDSSISRHESRRFGSVFGNFGGCSMADSGGRSLENAVEEFDRELSASLSAFAGSCPPFEYSWLDAGRGVSVSIRFEQQNERPGILPLLSKGKAVIGIKPEYRCSWDTTRRFLAVESSSFAVHPYAQPGLDPLFRVEYLRGSSRKYPTSHFHVHAHRDEFTHLLGFAAKLDTQKSAQVNTYFKRGTLLSDFHFPTGGPRFRPCLEDVLEALRVEFDLDVDNARWQQQLQNAREKWRRIQTAAVVRDCPDEAVRVLIEDFGLPVPEGWDTPVCDVEKMTRS